MNTVDHNTFQDQINNYLGGTPDDVFTWFSGYRMRFFAARAWPPRSTTSGPTGSPATSRPASPVRHGQRQEIYGVPVDYYPWCVFYRKSVLAAKGYTIPADLDAFLALCKQDEDGRPDADRLRRQGRLAGDGHVRHPQPAPERLRLPRRPDGRRQREKWTDPKVTTVFQTWAKLVPFYTNGYAGLTWQQACDTLVRKTAGMYFLGLFLTGEVATVDKTAVADLDFFPWPSFGTTYDAEEALDAPIDILMMSAKSPTLPADMANAKAT